ncbi:MAG: acylneuraminate cytidylyltransferase family protein [Candidatus Omnitrophica bacterium]|nr:acylneuraminate cytidylyltransferase family protein [Candidatus Omnitrophota bacterium]
MGDDQVKMVVRKKKTVKKELKILGLILARGGSTGIPGKNIKEFCGKPLIARTIECAQNSQKINRIITSTDSEEIAAIAKQYGSEVPFMRPSHLSQKLSRGFELYRYVISKLKADERYEPDIVCILLPTCPCKGSQDIDDSITKLIDTRCDWVFTICPVEHHPQRFFVLDGDRMHPYVNEPNTVIWGNRQELPALYRMSGAAIVTWRKHIENNEEYNIDNVRYKKTDVRYIITPHERAMDIDTPLDFTLAEEVFKNLYVKEGTL